LGRGDDGAALVEAAMVFPVLFAIILAIMELGIALSIYSTTSDTVRAGGRQASVSGSDALSDQQVLVKMSANAAVIPKGEIDFIVIWHAATTGQQPPTGCLLSASTPNATSVGVSDAGVDAVGACNVYQKPASTGGAFDQALDKVSGKDHTYFFGCTGLADPKAGQKVDCNWPGKDRRVTTTVRTNPTPHAADYVGVYMKVNHSYITRIIGTTQTVSDSVIALIEPQGYSAS
jgi:hypothetical protein